VAGKTAADLIRERVAEADAFAAAHGWGGCYSDRLMGNIIIRKYFGADGSYAGGGTYSIAMPSSADLSGPERIQYGVKQIEKSRSKEK
jgi:hypothetical protein